jgi:hypothetical protein
VTLGIAIICFASFTYADTSFSLTIGTGDFYASVGNYDYFPYSYSDYPSGYAAPRISFYDVMSDYGFWVDVAPFGRVWRPYASSNWRPYVQGHWVYTSYGPTWVGYEPWAWAGYHYGNWIWTQRYGWVWIPGYDWHPGHVVWSHGYDAIGWMPAPPVGYDYSRGYLSYQGQYNQFAYDDPDFDDYGDDYGYGQGQYYYGGPYYDPRYRDLYYNPGYRNIVINLWVFIGNDHFGYNNYSDYYLDRDFTRNVFERRLVRISSRPIQRPVMERLVKQKIAEMPVRVREIDTDKKRVKMIVPEGEDKDIRENANRVQKEVIAPGFVQQRKNFKGLQARNAQLVNKMFQQENKRPQLRNISGDEVVKEAKQVETQKEEKRGRLVREKADRVIQIEKEGKIHEARDRDRNRDKNRKPDAQVEERNKDRDRDRGQDQDQKVERKQETIDTRQPDRNQERDRDQQFEKRSSDKEKERGNSDKQQKNIEQRNVEQKNIEQKKRDFDSQIEDERGRSTTKQKDVEQRKQQDEGQDQDRVKQRNVDRDRQQKDVEQKKQQQDEAQDQDRVKQRNLDRDRQRNDEDQKINDRQTEERDKGRVVDKKEDTKNASDSDKKKETTNKKNQKNKDKKHNQNNNSDDDNER